MRRIYNDLITRLDDELILFPIGSRVVT